VNRHQFLAQLHKLTRPRTYLEIGIDKGHSIALTRVPSIGIDPDYKIVAEIQADVHLARTTSDEFFTRPDPLAHLPVPVLDLAFIDGMHLSEYVLRDFLAVERFTLPTSVVVFDDMLPRSIDEAARRRHTTAWTGDVYKALEALRELRPDLTVIEVATEGSGTAVVLFPDARRDGVLEGYDGWLDSAMKDDPQDVPAEVIARSHAVDPEWLLSFPVWTQLAGLRRRDQAPDAAQTAARAAFAELLAQLPKSRTPAAH
jgi:hypothetical protein